MQVITYANHIACIIMCYNHYFRLTLSNIDAVVQKISVIIMSYGTLLYDLP